MFLNGPPLPVFLRVKQKYLKEIKQVSIGEKDFLSQPGREKWHFHEWRPAMKILLTKPLPQSNLVKDWGTEICIWGSTMPGNKQACFFLMCNLLAFCLDDVI